ncbi:hypothetical protein B0T18DRAFT_484158 [Schizothecium vesticola]|uniref:Uncharacterized protein n=1 Tax=Schizothecium vesticola TaxID=314040 RepID=A0AA40KC51_9PEZI|nr:hypothetical protein B0T18DRAFT_484158 [Schizothecium vesticola]
MNCATLAHKRGQTYTGKSRCPGPAAARRPGMIYYPGPGGMGSGAGCCVEIILVLLLSLLVSSYVDGIVKSRRVYRTACKPHATMGRCAVGWIPGQTGARGDGQLRRWIPMLRHLKRPTSESGEEAESRRTYNRNTGRDGRVTLPRALYLRRSPMEVEPKYSRQARLPVRGRRPSSSPRALVEKSHRELRGRLIYTSAARGRLSNVSDTFKFSSLNDVLAVCSQIQLHRAPRGRFAR